MLGLIQIVTHANVKVDDMVVGEINLGMAPDEGKKLFECLVKQAQEIYPIVATGQFGAHMKINLCNDGPMTFILLTN